jgi:hypothetical protein
LGKFDENLNEAFEKFDEKLNEAFKKFDEKLNEAFWENLTRNLTKLFGKI